MNAKNKLCAADYMSNLNDRLHSAVFLNDIMIWIGVEIIIVRSEIDIKALAECTLSGSGEKNFWIQFVF